MPPWIGLARVRLAEVGQNILGGHWGSTGFYDFHMKSEQVKNLCLQIQSIISSESWKVLFQLL